jgi:hypothetical protein
MRATVLALRVLLLTIAAAHAGCAEKETVEDASAVRETPGVAQPSGVPDASEAVEAEGTVAYESDTNGAVQVNSVSANPVDYFDVLKDGERAFAGNPQLLGGAVEVPPGTYVVDVNRTQRSVTVEAGEKTILWTGDLVVRGEPETAYWYPVQGEERRVSANPPLLNTARALFPGTYTVFVHTSVGVPDHDLGAAEVEAGETTALEHRLE